MEGRTSGEVYAQRDCCRLAVTTLASIGRFPHCAIGCAGRGALAVALAGPMLAANNSPGLNTQGRPLRIIRGARKSRILVTPEADYPNFDYNTLKGVTLDGCQATCLADQKCRAFTFNKKAGWCFMKSDFGVLASTPGSTAGRVVQTAELTPSLERNGARRAQLLPRACHHRRGARPRRQPEAPLRPGRRLLPGAPRRRRHRLPRRQL